MELWLIRTVQNEIAGPYTKARLLDLIREGALTFRDEVCRANDYWIGLNELDEVRAKLGTEVPELLRAAVRKKAKAAGGDAASDATEELTQDVETDEATEPEVEVGAHGRGTASQHAMENPWFGAGAESNSIPGDFTQVRSPVERHKEIVQPLRPRSPEPPRVKAPASSVPESSLLQALGVSLALAALITVYWVIRLLRME